MKILGLITEYNPFHNGHLYHLNKSKEVTSSTHTVAVMSGNFLQRGEPALIHKWARAKMAVEAGVDLVIELPTPYSCATAELFAYGSVFLLDSMGIVDVICFGSEYGKVPLLRRIAEILEDSPADFENYLKIHMKEGVPFPVARSKALVNYLKIQYDFDENDLFDIEKIMNNPNNILAIEYLKVLRKLKSSITPYTIPRLIAPYHSTDITSPIASATAIRETIKRDRFIDKIRNVVPLTTFNVLQEAFKEGVAPVFKEDFQDAILTLLRRESLENLSSYFDVVEGLENKIHYCSENSCSLSELYNCIKSKRYTLTRIQRISMHVLLNIKKNDIVTFNKKGPQYIRVLAFNNKGRELLKLMKSRAKLPIVSKINHYNPQNEIAKKMLHADIQSTNIYALALKNREYARRPLDFYLSPYYYKF
ncbi:nucleotidyltransferase [Natronincola ferrireducens]|uniref:tRNA(Met) cytidine acetate ligase n=1 Tax=Natronincola ferrireducens TaxID=393762 RepID=A0A1G9BWS6_9FIRM|nr:nucleotidyltransferase [Natronincola ferrireducens]SDK43634.1 Predicted nucleotidyltransferase [Natronincola ferrireducens]